MAKKDNKNILEILTEQPCPVCRKKTLKLTEYKQDIPYFGITYIFSMECSNCDYKKADIEAEEKKEPSKYIFEITTEKDMSIRVVKSSEATVKIPHVTTITPGPAAEGFVTNIEGLLTRVKSGIETTRDITEEKEDRKKVKNLLKKLQRVLIGHEKLKIIIEDPSGNSAIISDRAVVSELKE